MTMDEIDRTILNRLQTAFPVCDRPYAKVAADMGIGEEELLQRLQCMLEEGVLSRFGPLFNASAMGGGLTLCAMAVPPEQFETVAREVNSYPEVAHNYERDHEFNMWFVLATEIPQRIDEVLAEIEQKTGIAVYNMPKEEEFFVGLRFDV